MRNEPHHVGTVQWCGSLPLTAPYDAFTGRHPDGAGIPGPFRCIFRAIPFILSIDPLSSATAPGMPCPQLPQRPTSRNLRPLLRLFGFVRPYLGRGLLAALALLEVPRIFRIWLGTHAWRRPRHRPSVSCADSGSRPRSTDSQSPGFCPGVPQVRGSIARPATVYPGSGIFR